MHTITLDPSLLTQCRAKTVIITGGANGIGAQTARIFHENGANVVIADLESARKSAESLIASLPDPSRIVFIPASITDWKQMTCLFKTTIQRFKQVDIVVANAGVMESSPILDVNEDENGDPQESTQAFKVIDINLKGTLNTLRLGLYYMKSNELQGSHRGSIILVSSTSGYVGGTGVAAYVASKHGVVGLLRASQHTAKKTGIRINSVAPFFTPTQITAGFSEKWQQSGLEANTQEGVARVIVQNAVDSTKSGSCCLAAGSMLREMEYTRMDMLGEWLGEDVRELMLKAGRLFDEMGGYPLPKLQF